MGKTEKILHRTRKNSIRKVVFFPRQTTVFRSNTRLRIRETHLSGADRKCLWIYTLIRRKIHRRPIMCIRRVRFEIKLRKNEHGEIPRWIKIRFHYNNNNDNARKRADFLALGKLGRVILKRGIVVLLSTQMYLWISEIYTYTLLKTISWIFFE